MKKPQDIKSSWHGSFWLGKFFLIFGWGSRQEREARLFDPVAEPGPHNPSVQPAFHPKHL